MFLGRIVDKEQFVPRQVKILFSSYAHIIKFIVVLKKRQFSRMVNNFKYYGSYVYKILLLLYYSISSCFSSSFFRFS